MADRTWPTLHVIIHNISHKHSFDKKSAVGLKDGSTEVILVVWDLNMSPGHTFDQDCVDLRSSP